MDHVVVDVEIQKTIEETPGGQDATDKLGVAVACVWEYRTQRMRVYGPEDVELLRGRLLEADRISGFNIFNFDFPVIWGIGKRDWIGAGLEAQANVMSAESAPIIRLRHSVQSKTDDMLRRIWQAKGLDPDNFSPRTHGGVGLDAIASATLGACKIGYGGDAPLWFQQGRIQAVVNYCADDVALERDLTDFVERYGYVLLADGKKLKIPQWKGGS